LWTQPSGIAFHSDHQQLIGKHLFIMDLIVVMNLIIVGLIMNARAPVSP